MFKIIFLTFQWNPNKYLNIINILCFNYYGGCISVPLAFSQSQLGRNAIYRVHGLSYTDYFTLILILLGLGDNSSHFLGYTQSTPLLDGKKKKSNCMLKKPSISDAEIRQRHIPEGKGGEWRQTPPHIPEEKGRWWGQTLELPEGIWQPICSC